MDISDALASPEVLWKAYLDGLRPDPVRTVSEWADARRVLSTKSSAEPGPWRTSRTPYLREVMDALSARSPVREVVTMFGRQLGKSETLNNWVGYTIEDDPAPFLLVQPSDKMAVRYSRQRIGPMITDSPGLRARIGPAKSRDAGNTTLLKEFPGGVLIMSGANAGDGLRSMPARKLGLDEIDAFEEIPGEGDPIQIAIGSTSSFGSKTKVYYSSTTTVKGSSNIEAKFLESDQSYFHVPCPYCGHEQKLEFGDPDTPYGIKWEDGKPENAAYLCASCGTLIPESKKPEMLEQGRWIAEKPERSHRIRGFQLSSLYSPLGWFSWEDMVREFLEAKPNPVKLKAWVNIRKGEPWEEKGDRPDWETLFRRREKYPPRSVPERAVLLTCGVDVQQGQVGQQGRLEAHVVAFGPGLEKWSVDYQVIPGDAEDDETWAKLDVLRNQQYSWAGGRPLKIALTAVDASYLSNCVYAYARKHPGKVIPIMGARHRIHQLIGQPKSVDIDWKGKKVVRGVMRWMVDTWEAKLELYGWLRMQAPLDPEEGFPPGYFHFPEWDQDWFKGLCAEQLVSARSGKPHWEKMFERNEVLDTTIYARAAAAIVGVDRWGVADWEKLRQQLTAPPAPKAKPGRRQDDGFLERWSGEDFWGE